MAPLAEISNLPGVTKMPMANSAEEGEAAHTLEKGPGRGMPVLANFTSSAADQKPPA